MILALPKHIILLFNSLTHKNHNKYETLTACRRDYSFPLFEINAGSTSLQENSGNSEEWALQGIFGRLNYDYKGKYLFEVNFRYDSSSRISPESRWGWFPSFSGGWGLPRKTL